MRDGFLDRARPFDRLSARDQRRGNNDHFSAHNRLRRGHVDIDIDLPFEA
jgi:hypothetical protein